jgi:hypothetical protein
MEAFEPLRDLPAMDEGHRDAINFWMLSRTLRSLTSLEI